MNEFHILLKEFKSFIKILIRFHFRMWSHELLLDTIELRKCNTFGGVWYSGFPTKGLF